MKKSLIALTVMLAMALATCGAAFASESTVTDGSRLDAQQGLTSNMGVEEDVVIEDGLIIVYIEDEPVPVTEGSAANI